MYIYIYICMYIHVWIYVCTYYVYRHVHTHFHLHMHTNIQIHMQRHMHTHIYIYIYTYNWRFVYINAYNVVEVTTPNGPLVMRQGYTCSRCWYHQSPVVFHRSASVEPRFIVFRIRWIRRCRTSWVWRLSPEHPN